ncbi:MAG TPA: oxidoreductase [Candidatus Dormibacteraeota bacterium]|nr:oxidoreductase [Candidatus Dormibacteraeota bacterium]
MPGWSETDIPDLSGRTIVITGANSGLGFEAALALAGKGAQVVLACRDQAKGRAAEEQIRARHPRATTALMALDLSSLADIRRFAEAARATYPRIDVLMNNAGVMALPHRQTADGFEMQFGTNHLGHFALTGLLLDHLLSSPGARVVTVSSGAHRMGRIRFDDPNWQRGYRKWPAYGQSKLANLLFAYELQRRLAAAGADTISVAAHPGYAATNLQAAGARMQGSSLLERVMDVANWLFAQNAAMGALPQLYAAVAPNVRGGEYYGPDGIGELWGHPRAVISSASSRDAEAARRLWALSEQLTAVTYPVRAAA